MHHYIYTPLTSHQLCSADKLKLRYLKKKNKSVIFTQNFQTLKFEHDIFHKSNHLIHRLLTGSQPLTVDHFKLRLIKKSEIELNVKIPLRPTVITMTHDTL